MPLHEDGMERPVKIRARRRSAPPRRPRRRRAPRRARPAARRRAARGRKGDVLERRRRAPRLLRRGSHAVLRISLSAPSSTCLGFAALHRLDVVLVFQQHAERVGDERRIERHGVELHQRRRPVERFGDAGRLEQVLLRGSPGRRRRSPRDSRSGASGACARRIASSRVGVRVVDPVVEAAPLQRVVDLAGAVRGDDDDRRLLGLDGPELRDRDLEVGQDLQQKSLERPRRCGRARR